MRAHTTGLLIADLPQIEAAQGKVNGGVDGENAGDGRGRRRGHHGNVKVKVRVLVRVAIGGVVHARFGKAELNAAEGFVLPGGGVADARGAVDELVGVAGDG